MTQCDIRQASMWLEESGKAGLSASLYEYFEDLNSKELKALEADQAGKIKLKKTIKTKAVEKKQAMSCSCC